MAIISSSIFSPNFATLSSTKPVTQIFSHPYLPFCPIQWKTPKRDFQLPSVASIPYPPINADYLESEFDGHGVSFTSLNDSCVVKMKLDNGSLVSLMLPSGLITSYKAPMWHGGKLELLHTLVSEAQDGGTVVKGGISLAFKCENDEGMSWSPSAWALHDVKGSSEEFIQVELISSNREIMVEVKHIITLREDTLSSELVLTNSKTSSVHLMGSIVNHLAVSTPDATYALGLERSNFCTTPSVLSNFSIIPPPPDLSQKKNSGSGSLWELLSSWVSRKQKYDDESCKNQDELEGEEDDNNKQLTEEMSRIYTNSPRTFTIIDRGRRNSIIVGRSGFNELYIFSPGSTYKWYGKYAYVCVGLSALLEPVTLAPGSEWTAEQHLHNPNT